MFSACTIPTASDSNENPETFTVTFDSQGGSSVENTNDIINNTTIDAPTNPVKTDDLFLGWYHDKYEIKEWVFSSDRVQSNITLYAKWNFVLKGVWNLSGTALNIEYTNYTCTIAADYPDLICGYNTTNKTAILYWSSKSKYSKITWEFESDGRVNIKHYSEFSTWVEALNATTIDLEYTLVK